MKEVLFSKVDGLSTLEISRMSWISDPARVDGFVSVEDRAGWVRKSCCKVADTRVGVEREREVGPFYSGVEIVRWLERGKGC